ncbi:hypothetical protein LEP1GSC199_1537 [Leptospira vanthielii serovar Holland str. Waz Holland = ATCC 700522]|uniref:Uncharacterized protein n=1 Tax=Leptospira vanthielii serovar Holland str. Waz Holland = ATCC 700522 TaxID=1218591 RepID=N1WDW3_9LEPT|nr:hypothetical protein LEP1GSC199_1537 [Leptospira vanthielii serovar Holland str. Waz Holland = ATCC 700522]
MVRRTEATAHPERARPLHIPFPKHQLNRERPLYQNSFLYLEIAQTHILISNIQKRNF